MHIVGGTGVNSDPSLPPHIPYHQAAAHIRAQCVFFSLFPRFSQVLAVFGSHSLSHTTFQQIVITTDHLHRVMSGTTQPKLKRTSTAAGLSTGVRTVKRRASKACHCCRSRKVRCDVVESGIPCTNCRLDEVECVVTEGKRRRKSCAEGEHRLSPCTSIEEDKETCQFSGLDDMVELDNVNNTNSTNTSTTSLRAPVASVHAAEFESNHHKPHMLCEASPQHHFYSC
jgi:hypothetical protein